MQELLLGVWRKTGKQILLITHDIEEAVFLASELILLSPGPGRIVERLALNLASAMPMVSRAERLNPIPRLLRAGNMCLAASSSSEHRMRKEFGHESSFHAEG